MDDKLYLGVDDLKIILSLIRFHYDKDEDRFKALSTDIARQLESEGKTQSSEFILALLGMCDVLVPMDKTKHNDEYMKKNDVYKIIDHLNVNFSCSFDEYTLEEVYKLVKSFPPADVRENIHGEWIHGVCNKCKYDWGKDVPIASVPNFCPNCGADMRKEKENG